MKKILVPTDFSKCAVEALKAAEIVAKKTGAEIHLLHLLDIPVDWVSLETTRQKIMYPDVTAKVKAVHTKLQGIEKELNDAGVKVKYHIEYLSDHSAILKFTKTIAADLIVMGTRGASGLREFFIGSLAQKIVRLSKCPVLVVEYLSIPFVIDDIVLATDLSTEGLTGFKQVLALSKAIDANLHLVFVNTPANFTETKDINIKLKLYQDEANGAVQDFQVYNTYDFEEGLGEFCKEKGCILAMITHGIKGGLTEAMVNHSDVPILSVPLGA